MNAPLQKVAEEKLRRLTAAADDDGVVLINGADVRPSSVRWLWQFWIAKGKLHVQAGQAGKGKTTINMGFVATVTSGGRWPDGSSCAPQNALIWSAEDDIADTLLPRLLAMGADPKRVTFVKGMRERGQEFPFDPSRDLAQLTAAAERIGNIGLMIVDPVVSAVGGDSNSSGEVRRALQPLVHLADALDAAVIGISHFSKTSTGKDPLDRVLGSVAFGALPRVVMVVAKVKSADGDRCILARAKSNSGPDEGGFEYRIVQRDVPGHPGLTASAIEWGQKLDGSAAELLAEPERGEGEEDSSALAEAVKFLKAELDDGPKSATELFKQARDAGHADRTVRRAKDDLGVESLKDKAGWKWHLPTKVAKMAKVAKVAGPENLGHLGHLGHLDSDAEVFR